MKIDQSNALKVAGIGAAAWWIVFGLPGARDLLSANHSEKQFVLGLAMLFGSFCGTAFYVCLAASLAKAIRARFKAHPGKTLLATAWILSPLPAIFASIAVLFLHAAEIGNW